MKRRIIAAFLLVCFVFCIAGCKNNAPESTKTVSDPTPNPIRSYEETGPIIPYEKITPVTWLRVADEKLSTAALEFILLNFGLRVDEIPFKSQNMTVNIEKIYEATDIPDLSTGLSIDSVKRISASGCFEDLNLRKTELKNYFKLWQGLEDGWEYTRTDIEQDGKLYCLVPVNRRASKAWIYNKSYFEKNNIAFPKTIDDLYTVLTEYKKQNPTSGPMWLNKYEPMQFTALLNAYGLTDDVWQTDADGNVFYLYGDKRWYEALEWLSKFEKAGFVPTDKAGELKALTDSEYEEATAKKTQQIIEFSDSWFGLLTEGKASGYDDWAVADEMIVSGEGVTPVLKANIPYIKEATCLSAYIGEDLKLRLLQFLDWCCTDEGNMWANFGRNGVTYTVDEDGYMTFLKYYSKEVTPDLDKKNGTVGEITIGRLFTTTPWDKVKLSYMGDRYSEEEYFLDNATLRLLYPIRFARGEDIAEDITELHHYDTIEKSLKKLYDEFRASTKKNGFSDRLWEKYYNSLIDAGLEEYTAYMQKRIIK